MAIASTFVVVALPIAVAPIGIAGPLVRILSLAGPPVRILSLSRGLFLPIGILLFAIRVVAAWLLAGLRIFFGS
ncbi:MAG: hypothetical protein H0W33_09210 [Gammaproteobacteria bacterium]|nr:hypothetical protein [Gammaproteobacteria bacterium]